MTSSWGIFFWAQLARTLLSLYTFDAPTLGASSVGELSVRMSMFWFAFYQRRPWTLTWLGCNNRERINVLAFSTLDKAASFIIILIIISGKEFILQSWITFCVLFISLLPDPFLFIHSVIRFPDFYNFCRSCFNLLNNESLNSINFHEFWKPWI